MYFRPDMGVPDADPPGGAEFTATVSERVDGTRTCRITPESDRPEADATEWVAAEEGSFVSLDRMD